MKIINHEGNCSFFLFIITIIIINIKRISLTSCEYDKPWIKTYSFDCNEGPCPPIDIESKICILNNTYIQTQWFNNILPVSYHDYIYVDIIIMSNGDLLIETSSYPEENKRIFYGLKKNGRPYFIDKDTLKETPNYSIDTSKRRFESFISNIKLNGTNENKEYIISIPKEDDNFELYNFDNNTVYEKKIRDMIKYIDNISFRGSVLKLNVTNNYYILGMSGVTYTIPDVKIYNFYLIKMSFNSIDFINYDPIVEIVRTNCSYSRMVSCFETVSKNIICFYQNISFDYVIAVYDYDLNNKTFLNLVKGSDIETTFYKAIHFSGEAGAFGYYIYNQSNDDHHFYIQFKIYNEENNSFSDYINSIPLIKINKAGNNLSYNIKLNDMIKLSDLKICLIVYHKNEEKFFVIIINNYTKDKIKIRYYYSNLFNLYNFRYPTGLRINLYNNFIAMASSFKNDYYPKAESYLIIFSYPNSTDFDVDITDNLKNFSNIYINPNEKCFIDNNLFGYIFYGINIEDYSDGYELKSKNNNTEIHKNNILFNDDQIEFVLSKKINFPQNGKIEYAMVLTEPNYTEFNQYSPIIDDSYCGEIDDEEDFFENNLYVGKTSYINIIIDSESITNDCNNENCSLCLKNDDMFCITCKYTYQIKNGEKECLSYNLDKESIISQSIPKVPITSQSIPKVPITSQSITSIQNTILPTTIKSEQETITTNSKTSILNISHPIKSELLNEKTNIIKTETLIDNKDDKNICSNEDIINNKCISGKMDISQLKEIKKNLLNLNYTKYKENKIIITENIIIQLSTIEDQENSDNNDISNIYFGKCEEILKIKNNIPISEQLIVYKTDIKSEDLSVTYVVYEVYHPFSLIKLDLSVCSEVEISINIPIKLNDKIEELYESSSESGYNIFNKNDSFYQDNCASYTTDNGTDILLSDRKKDIYTKIQSQSMCQVGCELHSYVKERKKIKCNCSINPQSQELTDLNIENMFTRKIVEETFYKTLNNSNFRVLKCYNLLFTCNSLKNIGEIIMSIIVFIFTVLMIVFCFTSKKQIDSYINFLLHNISIMKKNVKHSKKRRLSHRKSSKNQERMKIFPIKEEGSEPPRKQDVIMNTNNNIDNVSESKSKSSQNNSGNIFQNNIFLNVNLVKPKKKRKKKMKRNSLNPKKLKENENGKDIYKRKSANITAKIMNNFNSSEQLSQNKERVKFKALNNDSKYKSITDQELNTLEYKSALELDKRTYFQYYWSLLKRNQLLLFSFIPVYDYNIATIKMTLFLLSFSLYFSINGFFFSDSTMHKVYENKGKYGFIYRIPQIIYSTLVSTVINMILKTLSLSEKNFLEIKEITDLEEAKEKSKEVENCLKIKFIIFYLISFSIIIFFWYFISCFCAVYTNTQIILIKDTLISFCLSMIYPFGFNFIPGMFRIPALRAKNEDKQCLYKASIIIALFV